MSDTVRVGVIGCGHLGTFHARLYSGIEDAELWGVMDIDQSKAATLADSLGVRATTHLDELIEAVDAVSIATPTTTHRDVSLRCLEAGRAVLVEKPITETIEQGKELVDAAIKAELPLAVGHVERFNPAFLAAAGAIDSPRFVESHRLAPFVPRSLDIDVVLDLMIHDIDLTLALISEEIESIDAVGVPVLTSGEDIANARIRFANGAVANLTASRVSREKVRKIRFFGPRHYHSLDLAAGRIERVLLSPAAGEQSQPAAGQGGVGVAAFTSGSTNRDSRHDPASETPPSATGSAEGSAALDAYLASKNLRLEVGEVEVESLNALEEELRDFLGAVRGDTLRGASGAAGLRSLEVAQEIRGKVRESLLRLGLDPRR